MASRNVTLALPEELLERSRKYAAAQGTTLNQLIRNQLQKVTNAPSEDPIRRMFEIADAAKAKSKGPWKREDLYDR